MKTNGALNSHNELANPSQTSKAKTESKTRLPSEGQISKASTVTDRRRLPAMVIESKSPGNGIPIFVTNPEEQPASNTSLHSNETRLLARKKFVIQSKTSSAQADKENANNGLPGASSEALSNIEKRIEGQLTAFLEKEIRSLNEKLEQQRSLNKLLECDKQLVRQESCNLEQVV